MVDGRGAYLGTVATDVVTAAVEDASAHESPMAGVGGTAGTPPATGLADLLDPGAPTVAVTASADVALEALVQSSGRFVAVTDSAGLVVGVLSVGDLLRGYREALDANIGRTWPLSAHAVAIEERIGPHSLLAGLEVKAAGLSVGCVIVTIRRDDTLTFVGASTIFAEGDVVSALTVPDRVESVRDQIRGAP